MIEYPNQGKAFQHKLGKYLEVYFKKKLKEVNNFLDIKARMDHLDDLNDYYRNGCMEKNQNFIEIAKHVAEKMNEEKLKKTLKDKQQTVESNSGNLIKRRSSFFSRSTLRMEDSFKSKPSS